MRNFNYNRFKYQTRRENYKAFLAGLPEDYDYNTVDKYHETALFGAIGNENAELINILLERGANVNGDRRAKYYPIELAALNGSLDIVKILLSHSEFIYNRPDDGSVIYAAMFGRNDIIEILLNKGYDINRLVEGRAALHWAVQEHHLNTVKFLISKGAQVNLSDSENNCESSLRIACGEYNLGYIDKGKALQIIEELLGSGADINIRHSDGATELMAAVLRREIDLVCKLIEKGANVNLLDNEGRSALFYAYLRKEYDIAEYLISQGADEKVIDTYGNTLEDLKDEEKRKAIFIEWYYPEDDPDREITQ